MEETNQNEEKLNETKIKKINNQEKEVEREYTNVKRRNEFEKNTKNSLEDEWRKNIVEQQSNEKQSNNENMQLNGNIIKENQGKKSISEKINKMDASIAKVAKDCVSMNHRLEYYTASSKTADAKKVQIEIDSKLEEYNETDSPKLLTNAMLPMSSTSPTSITIADAPIKIPKTSSSALLSLSPLPSKTIMRCCPSQHFLKPFITSEFGWSCSVCCTVWPSSSWLYGCRICDWDVCESCHSVLPDDLVTITFISSNDAYGFGFLGNTIEIISQGTEADIKGVARGWRIHSVNGERQPCNLEHIQNAISHSKNVNKSTKITFQKYLTFAFEPDKIFGFTYEGNIINSIDSNTQVADIDIRVGSKIIAVNGTIVQNDTLSISDAIKQSKKRNKATIITFNLSIDEIEPDTKFKHDEKIKHSDKKRKKTPRKAVKISTKKRKNVNKKQSKKLENSFVTASGRLLVKSKK